MVSPGLLEVSAGEAWKLAGAEAAEFRSKALKKEVCLIAKCLETSLVTTCQCSRAPLRSVLALPAHEHNGALARALLGSCENALVLVLSSVLVLLDSACALGQCLCSRSVLSLK